MSIHPKAQRLIEFLGALGRPEIEDGTPQDARDFQAKMRANSSTGPNMDEVEDVVIASGGGALRMRIFRPAGVLRAAILYLHGGGWVTGSIEHIHAHARRLAVATQALVIAPGYRLAPEYPFPAALDDTLAALRWCRELAPATLRNLPLVIAGDSAGANLATAACLVARDSNASLPDLQILAYPVTDGRCDSASYRRNASGYILTARAMEWFWDHYAPGNQRLDPRASPLLTQDLSGLPPAFVFTAEYDPLMDEGDAYARRLQLAGVPTEHRCYAGMVHGFFTLGAAMDSCAEALADCAAFLDRHLPPAGSDAVAKSASMR